MFTPINASTDRFLADLDAISRRAERANRQVSSGLRLQTISDDPDQVSNLLQIKAQVSRNDQIKFNLSRTKTEVDAAEGALTNAALLMDTARQLAAQGASNLTSVTTREQLANQVGDILAAMVGLARTQVEGRYVFSGNSDGTIPYTIDLSSATPVSGYLGSTATRQIEHPNGSLMKVSLTAQDIFDNGGPNTNVFQVLQNLRAGLLTNDVAMINTAAENLATATQFLSAQHAFYGDVQVQIQDAISFQAKLDINLQQQLSVTRDADATQALIELQQTKTAQDAALQAHMAMPRRSLFDFIG